jgi:hypothetical protein
MSLLLTTSYNRSLKDSMEIIKPLQMINKQ